MSWGGGIAGPVTGLFGDLKCYVMGCPSFGRLVGVGCRSLVDLVLACLDGYRRRSFLVGCHLASSNEGELRLGSCLPLLYLGVRLASLVIFIVAISLKTN